MNDSFKVKPERAPVHSLKLSLAFALVGFGFTGCNNEKPKQEQHPAKQSAPERLAIRHGLPVTEAKLEELLKETDGTGLVAHEFKVAYLTFTIQLPAGTTFNDGIGESQFLVGTQTGLAIRVSNKAIDRHMAWWKEYGPLYDTTKHWLADGDTLFTEVGAGRLVGVDGAHAAKDRFHFYTQLTCGPVDFTVRHIKKDFDLAATFATKQDCLLMLKCARTIALKSPLPDDSKEVLKLLGAGLEFKDGRVSSLSMSQATESAMPFLAGLSDLESLSLDSGPFDKALEYVEKMPKLRKLSVALQRVDTKPLARLKSLEQLALAGSRITDDSLASLVSLDNLHELNLNFCELLTDAGLRHLEILSGLQHLYLIGTKVSDAGIPRLRKMNRLQSLFLDGTKITDASIPYLQEFKELQQLQISSTGITQAGFSALKAALPKTKISKD